MKEVSIVRRYDNEGYSIKTAYKTKKECESVREKFNKQTNYKYPNFTQSLFNAGDERQFHKLGLDKTQQPLITKQKIPVDNFWRNIKLDNSFKFTKNEISSTFEYIFKLLKKGTYVQIYNNELTIFLPFNNVKFKNIWSEQLKVKPGVRGKSREEKLFNYAVENSFRNPLVFINKDIKQWYANNCIFRNTIHSNKAKKNLQYKSDEGDKTNPNFLFLLQQLCLERKVPNVEFFINYRDFPILKKNFTDPYDALWNGNSPKLNKLGFKVPKIPIMSQSITKDFYDIMIPHDDDIERVFQISTLPSCRNIPTKLNKITWIKKKDICVFRGGATGCGLTVNNNMRLKASYLSLYTDILDSKITNYKRRIKKEPDDIYLGILNPKEELDMPKEKPSYYKLKNKDWKNVFLYQLKGKQISQDDQSNFKYILHIDGNVSGFRLSRELSMGSLILKVDGPYKMWFTHKLIPYNFSKKNEKTAHYIPIKKDLKNLIPIIEWCKKNDKICKKIAQNGVDFYNTFLNKDSVLDYMQAVLCKITNKRK